MNSFPQLQILTPHDAQEHELPDVLELDNGEDPMALAGKLGGIARISLHFPHFTDGRAYSQAYLLRRRLGFTGDLRAMGDVQVDQLLQMARIGFSSVVLKEGLDPADAERQLARFSGFYQTDARASFDGRSE